MIAIIFGAAAIAAGVYGIHHWSGYLVVFLKGTVPVSILCAGVVAVLAGLSSLRK